MDITKQQMLNNILGGGGSNGPEIFPLFGENKIDEEQEFPEVITLMPLRNTVLFPGVVIPISLGRKKSLKLIKNASKNKKAIGIITQLNPDTENPDFSDLYTKGTIANVLKIFDMPDGGTTAIIQGQQRFEILEQVSEKPQLKVKYNTLPEIKPEGENPEFELTVTSIKELAMQVIELSKNIPKEAGFAVKNINRAGFLINFIASNSDMESSAKQVLLEIDNLQERAEKLLVFLTEEVQRLQIKDNIHSKVRDEMNQHQREYFLNEQMKAIREELGTDDPGKHEAEELEKKAANKKWGKEVKEVFQKQLKRLRQINPMSPDYSMQLNYLQTLVELPWGKYSKDNFDLTRAKKVLEADHFGLDKVKDRILEHLAVLKLKGDLKAPIICLYGPPGVGKTSLGKSIAKALGRKYTRMSLGGLHDESEIRGHRKTYIGALPGRIIQNLKKVQSSNPVFMLDEIDKIGNDFRGDPSSALLEVLDPEQNNTFYDNYLELDYDLSKILFIATANSLSSIKPALRDRMELINVSGYIVEEKVEIGMRHIVPRQLKEHGLRKNQLKFTKDATEEIVTNYTRESGVRGLDKKVAEVVRKVAKKVAFEEEYDRTLSRKMVNELLGPPKYQREKYEGNEFAGVVTGLAWTSVGGTILYIESSLSKGNGKLTLTGNLGDVMKESAVIALEYIRRNAKVLGIDNKVFSKYSLHIHVPEGATPKDGPSAGITMLSSMVSVYTQKKIRPQLAMTGEITLRGKVLPVGGIKEKILAAKRADIKEIILSKENKKDIEEINDIYLKGLTFHYADTADDVLKIAILDESVQTPIQFELGDVKKK